MLRGCNDVTPGSGPVTLVTVVSDLNDDGDIKPDWVWTKVDANGNNAGLWTFGTRGRARLGGGHPAGPGAAAGDRAHAATPTQRSCAPTSSSSESLAAFVYTKKLLEDAIRSSTILRRLRTGFWRNRCVNRDVDVLLPRASEFI